MAATSLWTGAAKQALKDDGRQQQQGMVSCGLRWRLAAGMQPCPLVCTRLHDCNPPQLPIQGSVSLPWSTAGRGFLEPPEWIGVHEAPPPGAVRHCDAPLTDPSCTLIGQQPCLQRLPGQLRCVTPAPLRVRLEQA